MNVEVRKLIKDLESGSFSYAGRSLTARDERTRRAIKDLSCSIHFSVEYDLLLPLVSSELSYNTLKNAPFDRFTMETDPPPDHLNDLKIIMNVKKVEGDEFVLNNFEPLYKIQVFTKTSRLINRFTGCNGWTMLPCHYVLGWSDKESKISFRIIGGKDSLTEDECTNVFKEPGIVATKDLYAFLSLLSSPKIIQRTIKPNQKKNEKRIRQGKLPFLEYRTLQLDLTKVRYRYDEHLEDLIEEDIGCLKRLGPRMHTRRGHDRQYKTGRKIWVTHCLVGNKHGTIEKEYSLKNDNINITNSQNPLLENSSDDQNLENLFDNLYNKNNET